MSMKKFLSWERIRQLVPCWEFIRYGGITFLYGVASTVEFNNVVKVGTGGDGQRGPVLLL